MPAAPAAAPAVPEPSGEELDFGGESETPQAPIDDKPFDDQPFDAGVEADEETDPKKFIEQLTGKLGQSLRKYTEEQGQPDFELEKFAINSLLSATHTAEMDEEDKKDIIKKVNTAGDDGKDNENAQDDTNNDSGDSSELGDELGGDLGGNEEGLEEFYIYESMNNLFISPKKNNMFQPGSNDKLNEGEHESNNYMFWQNIKGIHEDAMEILKMNCEEVDALIADGHAWAVEHVITSKDDVEEVYHFLESNLSGGHEEHEEEGEMMYENHESNNYMFWSSLKTIHHAAGEILSMNCDAVDAILSDGHGWALDHIATSNDDMEEVYHFLANTLDAYGNDYSEWSKPMALNEPTKVSKNLAYHLDNGISLGESVFRYGSDNFKALVKEVKKLKENNLITLNENDEFIVEDYDNGFVMINEGKVTLNTIFEELDINQLNEAEYQGKKVELGKPKRGGSKKFYVYVRNPKNGKVKKVSFGAKSGGGNLAVKLRDPKARKAFADRHNCKAKNDKTKAGYWACRLPRYAKLLGLSGGGTWW